jgi:hypothetical protein
MSPTLSFQQPRTPPFRLVFTAHQGLSRKCQQLGVSMAIIPEYSRSANLNVHPFIAHPFVALHPSLVRVCEEALITKCVWTTAMTHIGSPCYCVGGVAAGQSQSCV